MKTSAALFAIVAAAGTVLAGTDVNDINGLKVDNRVWNDFATSNLAWGPAGSATNLAPLPTDDGTLPLAGGLQWRDEFPAGTVGNFANKHLAWLSSDGGATAHQGNLNQSYVIEFDIKIDVPATAPRREGGMQINNPRPSLGYTDEGQVMVASDGEVAVFGGVMPFTGLGNVYTAGTTAHLSFQYFAPGAADPVLGAYLLTFTDAVTGVHSSGMKFWSPTEPDGLFGINHGANFGLKAQNQRNPFVNDYSDITYSNIAIVPAPGALALVGLGGLIAGRRRR